MRCKRHVIVGPSVPSLCSSHDGVAHCLASHASQTTRACESVGSFASLVTRRRRSLLRFSCIANDACLWRRRSLRFARHMAASLIATLLLRRKRRVPVAPSVPSLRSSHGDVAHYFASLVMQTAHALAPLAPALCSSHIGVAHCFASPASQTTRACGASSPFASLGTWQRRSVVRFSCIAYDVCLWRRRSLRFARHIATSRITPRL